MRTNKPEPLSWAQPAAQLEKLAIGPWLGAYEILALIGAGGMGEVYRARDTGSQEPMFRLLGIPKEHKRRVLYDTGHDIPETKRSKKHLTGWMDIWGR